MRSTLAKANHLPYGIEGKVVAYRYGLIPDENAYKKNAYGRPHRLMDDAAAV